MHAVADHRVEPGRLSRTTLSSPAREIAPRDGIVVDIGISMPKATFRLMLSSTMTTLCGTYPMVAAIRSRPRQ